MASSSSSSHSDARRMTLLAFFKKYEDIFCSFNVCKDDKEITLKMDQFIDAFQKCCCDDMNHGLSRDGDLSLSNAFSLYIDRFLHIHNVTQKKKRNEHTPNLTIKQIQSDADIVDGIRVPKTDRHDSVLSRKVENVPTCSSKTINIIFGSSSSMLVSDDSIPGIETLYHTFCANFDEVYAIDINDLIDSIDPIMHRIIPYYRALRNMMCYMVDLYTYYNNIVNECHVDFDNAQIDLEQAERQFKFTTLFIKSMLVYLKDNNRKITIDFKQHEHDDHMEKMIPHLRNSLMYYDNIISDPVKLMQFFRPTILEASFITRGMRNVRNVSFSTLYESLDTIIDKDNYVNIMSKISEKEKIYECVQTAFYFSVL